jgi:tetratricopeptide (TPR) repeat protein
METVAQRPRLTLAPEGRLGRSTSITTLVGHLGLLRATGVFAVTRRKLSRKIILDKGAIAAVVSNARDDRFADWLLAQDALRSDRQVRLATLLDKMQSPLTAGAVLASGLVEAEALQGHLEQHATALIREMTEWREGNYEIVPGVAKLGDEPRVGLHAAEFALRLAREIAGKAPAAMPKYVLAAMPLTELPAEISLGPDELQALDALSASPTPPPSAHAEALRVLVLAGLVVQAEPPKPAASADPSLEPLDAPTLERWLACAEIEDFAGLLGVAPGTEPAAVRQAYYRTVRRYHPDRFREGELASYQPRVEAAFRLVHEALEILTDPGARERREREKRRDGQPDPAKIVRSLRKKAREALVSGRRVEALEQLDAALKVQADDVESAFLRAVLLLGNPRRRDEASATLRDLAGNNPMRADILAASGIAMRRAGKEETGRRAIEAALAAQPTDVVARAANGETAATERACEDPFLALLFA